MIERGHELPMTRQAKLLKLSWSSVYYRPRPVSPADLAIMRRIDELHLNYPFAGSRMLRDLLRGEGIQTGRQRVARMMKRMGIEALYRRPNRSLRRATRSTLTCCVGWRSRGPTRCGRWTSPTSRWRVASSTWPQ